MPFANLELELEHLKAYALKRITSCAARGATTAVVHYSTLLERAETLLKQVNTVRPKLEVLRTELLGMDKNASKPAPAPTPPCRVLSFRVSAAMVRNHMLMLTPYRKQVGYGEQMHVITDFNQFTTKFLKAGNKLRERGGIRAFYAKRGVKAGDELVLEEYSPGNWYLDTVAERRRWRAVSIIATSDVKDWGPDVKKVPADKPVIALRPKIKTSEA